MGGGETRVIASIEAEAPHTSGCDLCFIASVFLGSKRRNDASMNATTATDCGLFMGGMRVGRRCTGNAFFSLGMMWEHGSLGLVLC